MLRTTSFKRLLTFLLVAGMCLSNFPINLLEGLLSERNIVDNLYWSLRDPNVIDKGLKQLLTPPVVHADTFSMQTGYYMGNATDNRSITNIGFSPDLVLLKDNSAAGNEGMLWKSGVMSGESTAKLGEAEADVSTNHIQSLDLTGFTIGIDNDVNANQVPYFWMAFGGSECDSGGTFCVGAYTGNGSSQSIGVGFQPDVVVVKRSGTSFGVWRSSSMGANTTNYFSGTAQDTGGQMIQSLTSTGFDVGNNATVNTNGNTYWYFAFKEVSGFMDVGTYTGNGTDNRNITSSDDAGLTFHPNLVMVKSTHSASPTPATFNISENYGDRSFLATDAASTANRIQELRTAGGFQVGTTTNVNGSGNTLYYMAFAGASPHIAADSFTMNNGSYSGNGTSQSVSGVGFQPDLVIIKHENQGTPQYAVFRNKDMKGDRTSYFALASTGFTGGITSLDGDGFSVGSHATVNTSGDTYHWTAFGNAWDYEDHSGAADFMVGSYIGNAGDNRNINRMPFEPDLMAIKRNGSSLGVWRTSDMTGDSTIYFSATAQSTNRIQAFNSDGFQRGTNGEVGSNGNIYYYFAFKNGSNFTVNNYTGNGTSQDITSVGFQPDLLWTKKSTGGTARGGILRSSTQSGDAALPFLNANSFTTGITAILSNGFSVGSGVEANENTGVFRYAAWRIPPLGTLTVDIVDADGASVADPSVGFSATETTFDCQSTTGTFGISSERIRVSNTTSTPSWSLSIAADGGAGSTWTGGSGNYDFNDDGGTPEGCADGGDTDSLAGRMNLDFGSASVTPEGGCTVSGISFGSNAGFTEGSVDSITLLSASGGADTDCYWDVQNVGLQQYIPGDQPAGSYAIPMTLTIVAI